MEKDWDKLRSLLDENYSWPASYTYKFIVPVDKVIEVKSRYEGYEVSEKPSSKGKYVSVTLTKVMSSADEVIEGHQRIGGIEGVISL